MRGGSRHASAYRRGVWCVFLLGISLAVGGCVASHTAVMVSPTANTAPRSSATQVVPPPPTGGRLGSIPTDCTTMPPPQTFTLASGFGGGFSDPVSFRGGSPVWELGLATTLQVGQFGGPANPYPSYKVMWIVGPNVTAPVTLTGRELHTGRPLWFQIYPSNDVPTSNPNAQSVYTTTAVLDPQNPNRGATDNPKGHWAIWGIGLIPLAAGCYTLDVSSSAGQWSTVFAAGD